MSLSMNRTSLHVLHMTENGRPFSEDLRNLFSAAILDIYGPVQEGQAVQPEEVIKRIRSLTAEQSIYLPALHHPKEAYYDSVKKGTLIFGTITEVMAQMLWECFLDAKLINSEKERLPKQMPPGYPPRGSLSRNLRSRDSEASLLTPKGIVTVQRYASTKGIHYALIAPFQLVILEREKDTDKLLTDRKSVEFIFHRFVGPGTPRSTTFAFSAPKREYRDQETGLLYANQPKIGLAEPGDQSFSFSGKDLGDWLMCNCTTVDMKEAMEIGKLFIEEELIVCVPWVNPTTPLFFDRLIPTITINKRISSSHPHPPPSDQFQPTTQTRYQTTGKGEKVIREVTRRTEGETPVRGSTQGMMPESSIHASSNTFISNSIWSDTHFRKSSNSNHSTTSPTQTSKILLPNGISSEGRYTKTERVGSYLDSQFSKPSTDKSSIYGDTISEIFKEFRKDQNDLLYSPTAWITYQVSWELPAYLSELFDPQQKLSQVLTLTAGFSDEFSDGIATTVGDYMKTTWQDTGVLLLEAIETWLSNKESSRKGKDIQRKSDIEIRIKGETDIATSQLNGTEKSTNAKVFISAEEKQHVDIAAALSWLCSSVRFSPYDGLSSSDVNISKIPSSEDIKDPGVRISPLDLVPCSELRGCWNFLFAQSVIAKGFPIPARKEGKGLEISFPTMAMLATIQRLVEYDQGLVGEGLNTLLVPIKLLNKDQAIQWHVEEKMVPLEGGMEYQDRSVASILTSLGRWHRELLPVALASKRAFLGWTHGAKVTIGTVDGPTDVKDSGAPLAQKGSLYINSYNATISSGGLGFGGPGFGVTAVTARGQSYCMRKNSTILGYKLRNAARNQVILYDAGEKIAWQVPQSCLMLHMIHATIRHWDLKSDCSQGGMKYADYGESPKSGEDNGLAALKAINASRDLKFSFGDHDKDTCSDILERLCLTLERVTEFHAEQKSKPERGRKKPPKWILGIELTDVIREQNIWRVKESRVQQPWSHLADDACPVFFCKNLGQVIVPTDLGGLCKTFQQVPAGNEYFVTTGLAVCQMLAKHEQNRGAHVSEKVRWLISKPMIPSHGRLGKRSCTHTHQLLCENPFQFRSFPKTTESEVERHSGGAFIFHGSPALVCEDSIIAVKSSSKMETNQLMMESVGESSNSHWREYTTASSSTSLNYPSQSSAGEQDDDNSDWCSSTDLSNKAGDLQLDRLSIDEQLPRGYTDALERKAQVHIKMSRAPQFEYEQGIEANNQNRKGKGKEVLNIDSTAYPER